MLCICANNNNNIKLPNHQPTRLSRLERLLCTYGAVGKKKKYHPAWLQEMSDSCTSVLPNTRAWDQQELNKTNETDEEGKKRGVSMERSKAGMKKKYYCLSLTTKSKQ